MAEDKSTDNRRRGDRRDLTGQVVLQVPAQAVTGTGQNVSEDGIYFLASEGLQVEVHVPGEAEPRRGRLLRLQALGEGRFGLAVKFGD